MLFKTEAIESKAHNVHLNYTPVLSLEYNLIYLFLYAGVSKICFNPGYLPIVF